VRDRRATPAGKGKEGDDTGRLRLPNPWLGGEVNSSRNDEFREYVATRGPALLRSALQLTGDRAEAEDLLQAALAKTYLAWDRIEDRAAMDGYVRRAMVNTQISWWRRRKLDIYPTDELPEQPVDDHTRRSELHDALGRALDRLPERQRLAVKLRYYEDMPETEIARLLGVSVGTVKSTVSRAMAKLRDDTGLEDDFPDIPPQQP
jgi:RNA polymerase sigma-70 factor (sigma-E family)